MREEKTDIDNEKFCRILTPRVLTTVFFRRFDEAGSGYPTERDNFSIQMSQRENMA
jgi:hypothetical protein